MQGKEELKPSPPTRWCHLATRNLCKSENAEITNRNDIRAKPTKRNNDDNVLSNKSSDVSCSTTSSNKNIMKRIQWPQRINLVISVSILFLLLVLIISEYVLKNLQNGSQASDNTTSVTYTNVIITPCGNYFWRSAGVANGNWLASDAAIKKEKALFEEAVQSGVDWGYNGILGDTLYYNLRDIYFRDFNNTVFKVPYSLLA